MHFSRISRRKKRLLPLCGLRAKPKAPPAMSWREPLDNVPGRELAFYQGCKQFHSTFCGCPDFINHLLRIQTQHPDAPGSSTPRSPLPPVTRRALPSPVAPSQSTPWRGAGGGTGDADAAGPGAGGEDYAPGDLEDLYAAVDADAE